MNKVPKGWIYNATDKADFEVSIDSNVKHSGTRSASLRSIVESPKPFGNLMNYFSAEEYLDKRLRMRAWVKTELEDESRAQLWLRIDGEWRKGSGAKAGAFDNMDDRPIVSVTDWQQYDLVVNVADKSTGIAFGLMLFGKGQVWLDDVSFEAVSEDVPLTGSFTKYRKDNLQPENLNFEED